MPAVITIPNGLLFGPGCGMGQQRFDSVDVSETDGSGDARIRGRPRWVMQLVPPQRLRNNTLEARLWQKMILDLQGQMNVLAAYDPLRQSPIGGAFTGSPSTDGALAKGSTSMLVNAGTANNGKQLNIEDLVQIGTGFGTSELVRVTAQSTVSGGQINVFFDPPLRLSYAAATPVVTEKPVAYFRNTADKVTWQYTNNGLFVTGYSLDLIERWR